jgi:hypothetical protein
MPQRAEAAGQQAHLRGFAAAFGALKGDEQTFHGDEWQVTGGEKNATSVASALVNRKS